MWKFYQRVETLILELAILRKPLHACEALVKKKQKAQEVLRASKKQLKDDQLPNSSEPWLHGDKELKTNYWGSHTWCCKWINDSRRGLLVSLECTGTKHSKEIIGVITHGGASEWISYEEGYSK